MKKISIVLLAVAGIMGTTSCDKGSEQNSEALDSLTYAYGVATTQGLKPYLIQMGMDTTDMNAFVKGLKEGFKEVPTDKLKGDAKAKAIGKQIGQQLRGSMFANINTQLFGAEDSTSSISEKIFLDAFIATVLGKETKMTAAQAQEFLQGNEERVKEQTLANTPENKATKEEGEAFLAANAKKEGVVTTKSGLQYKVITKGTGETPADGDAVKVIYKGKLISGEIFDESQKDSTGVATPTDLQVDYVVKGWQEALKMMPVGSKWQLFVPYNLAYGSRAAGEKIKPFSTLIFELELKDLTKSEKPAATPGDVEVL